ncbi:Glutamate synthase [NADH] amyloplastic [Bienertia sinuspersici]
MKGGDCKDAFVAWKLCAEESDKNEEDSVEKCFEEVKHEENEAESVNNDQNTGSKDVEERAEI